MAYNSDGYIMIDFSMVDFRKTNQTIDGLFDRCEKVIGTNKFVIVINANNKTPLPSTVCITNGQYVIESVLYTFSISSADNLHITKKTTPEELIDDDHITLKTTWSSSKINSEFNDIKVKSFTYTGDGNATHTIKFPSKPNVILGIYGLYNANYNVNAMTFGYGQLYFTSFLTAFDLTATSSTFRSNVVSYNDDEITITAVNELWALNRQNETFTVYYI